MNHAPSARSHALVTLIFATTLAVLGFQVAAGWGVIGGALVGAMIASRVLLRRAARDASEAPPIIVVAHAGDDTPEIDARRVARLKREFDRAVFDAPDLAPKHTPLH